ncbi:TauD/TfdA family dioxygenase [Ilumatobacter nonamiensis]|uniref:TauD/TfdA family dioxygenase n=1 Tax=Ilumatobacter nonamiensis TaxID=467093 RepID=UPI00034890D3|nr:TauD/TfdA family dioxygenase [Ilumatobacter nonamiensis]
MAIIEFPEFAPLDDVIEPAWWSGVAPLDRAEFTIDAGDFAMDAADLTADSALARRMQEMFDRVGLVHLTNTGLTDLADMRTAAKFVIDQEMRYEGGANPRDRIAPNVYEVGAPLSAWLHYHHEMAYVGRSTRSIGFLASDVLPPPGPGDDGVSRGATFVSDSIGATDKLLSTEFGQKLKDLGVCYHRNLTDREAFAGSAEYGVYNHWQKSFDTDDPEIAASRARDQRLAVEWGPNRLLQTRYYCPAFEYFEHLDRNVLYCSLADHGMWFDTWPLVQHLPYHERPLHMTFGDDSEFSPDELQQWIDLYDDFGMPINWKQGDVAVICNYRWAHGRPGIDLAPGEARQLGVVLGEQYHRVGVRSDGW